MSFSRWDRDRNRRNLADLDRDRRFVRDRRDRDCNLADFDDRDRRRSARSWSREASIAIAQSVDRDHDRRRSAQFRWSRSRSWCVGVDRSIWLGVWVRAVKLWERQCVCERGVHVRERRKTFEVKIWAEIDLRCFWLNLRSNWKYFQFDRIYHANQTRYFLENDFQISFSAKTNGA